MDGATRRQALVNRRDELLIQKRDCANEFRELYAANAAEPYHDANDPNQIQRDLDLREAESSYAKIKSELRSISARLELDRGVSQQHEAAETRKAQHEFDKGQLPVNSTDWLNAMLDDELGQQPDDTPAPDLVPTR